MARTTSVIEETIKALTEFEAELDKAKGEAEESKKKLLKDAGEWAQSARTKAVSKAQEMASERLAKAKAEAEQEADSIKKKGEAALRDFEASISKKKAKGAEHVLARLLGESE